MRFEDRDLAITDNLIIDEKQIKLRKYRCNILKAGTAIIAFEVWSVLKGIMSLFFVAKTKADFAMIIGEGLNKTVFYVMFFGIIAIDFLIRLYVGKSAIAESKDADPGNKYIVWLILLGICSTISCFSMFISDTMRSGGLNYVVALIVELTLLSITIKLLFSIFGYRKLKKEEG